MKRCLPFLVLLAFAGARLLGVGRQQPPPAAPPARPFCDRPHSFDDLRVRVVSVDPPHGRLLVDLENPTARPLWTYQTDDGRSQEPLHGASAEYIDDEPEMMELHHFRICVPPMDARPAHRAIRCAYTHTDRTRYAEFGPPAIVEIPAGTTLQREIRWKVEVHGTLIVQIGYGYSEPDFRAWMGGAEWQWARVFEWQHIAASPPFAVPTGK